MSVQGRVNPFRVARQAQKEAAWNHPAVGDCWRVFGCPDRLVVKVTPTRVYTVPILQGEIWNFRSLEIVTRPQWRLFYSHLQAVSVSVVRKAYLGSISAEHTWRLSVTSPEGVYRETEL